MKQRLHVITLAVDDLERALAFYRDGLGLSANGAIAMFELDGGLIHPGLYPRRREATDRSRL